MINRLLIEQRLALIISYLAELTKLSQTPKKEFLSDKIKSGAAESYLRRSLEAIFDIGRHLLAKSGSVEMAAEYKSIARGLAEKEIINQQLGLTLVEMAGYRNRLVHLYNQVTEEELYNIITNYLIDIETFVREIRDYLINLPNDI